MKKVVFLLLWSSIVFSQSKDSSKIRIAIVPFKNNTGEKSLDQICTSVGESIVSHLSGLKKFHFIERIQMDKALTEQNFQMTDLVNPENVQQAGKILGVEYIIIGDVQKYKDRFRINARRMRVEDGKLEEAVSAEGPEDDLFDLQDEIGEKFKELFEE